MKKANVSGWSIKKTIQRAKEALGLVQEHASAIAPRLSEGLLDNLPAAVTQLEELLTRRPAKIIEGKGLRATEIQLAKAGLSWVGSVREAVKRRAKGTGLVKSVGVGEPLSSLKTSGVVSAIDAILTAAAENPDLMCSCGILDADIQEATNLRNAIVSARDDQDSGFEARKNLTTLKNVIQGNIQRAIEEISTAGYIQLRKSQPLVAQRFKALVSIRRRTPQEPAEDTSHPPVELPRKETPLNDKIETMEATQAT